MYRLREAHNKDNEALLALTRACPMAGTIALRIDRQPDFFSLVRQRGRGQVLVVEQKEKVIACISLCMQEVHWKDTTAHALYISDLKVHPAHRRGRAAFLLMRGANEFARHERADLAYLLTPEGNDPLLRILQGRAGFPEFRQWRTFSVFEFKPKGKSGQQVKIEAAKAEEVYPLWRDFQSGYTLGRSQSEKQFVAEVWASATEFRVVRRSGKLIAVAGLCDMGKFKQNVVLDMPLWMRIGGGIAAPYRAIRR